MGTCSKLATYLDERVLDHVWGVQIAPASTPDKNLPERTGAEVAGHLAGRCLLHYLRPGWTNLYLDGTDSERWVTPTSYSPEEAISCLNLPRPEEPPLYCLLLDPSKIDVLGGPRWVDGGAGIEYHLPRGFSKEALVFGWALPVT